MPDQRPPSASFESIGVDDIAFRVYRTALERPRSTVRALAELAGLSRGKTARAVQILEETGFLVRVSERPLRFVPIPPDVAVEARMQTELERFESARAEAKRLGKEFPYVGQEHPELTVEQIVGTAAIQERQIQIEGSAADEVLLMDSPPYAVPRMEPNPIELNLLGRGVGYRVLYGGTSLEIPGKFARIEACVAAGEEARLLAEVPLKLLIADRSTGVVYQVGRSVVDSVLIVHASPILDALVKLFETEWARAAPLALGPTRGPRPKNDEEGQPPYPEILSLLAGGVKDDVIARQLKISVRTVRRRVAHIMRELDVTTRFQAGLEARARDWC